VKLVDLSLRTRHTFYTSKNFLMFPEEPYVKILRWSDVLRTQSQHFQFPYYDAIGRWRQ
jgi:hypothetical protein